MCSMLADVFVLRLWFTVDFDLRERTSEQAQRGIHRQTRTKRQQNTV